MDQAGSIEIIQITAVLIAVMLLMLCVVVVIAFLKAPIETSNVLRALIQSGNLTRMVTIFGIVTAIYALRVLDKISSEATIASISGIAGYVLGQVQRRRTRQSTEDDKTSN